VGVAGRRGLAASSPTVTHPPSELPLERPEAVHAQIEEARALLRADALVLGSDPALVDAALDAAADRLAHAHVHAFIGTAHDPTGRSTPWKGDQQH
jgi:hypothetical protein